MFLFDLFRKLVDYTFFVSFDQAAQHPGTTALGCVFVDPSAAPSLSGLFAPLWSGFDQTTCRFNVSLRPP